MSGESLPSRRTASRTNRLWVRTALLGLSVAAVALVIVLSMSVGSAGVVGEKGSWTRASLGLSTTPAAPAAFSVVNFTANNTTVDVTMAFNVSVDIVNLTGGALNVSNFTYAWTGLPAFVPGDPGSGCVGVNPVNYTTVSGNNSSLLDCSAYSAGALSISVTATNFTGASNSSSASLKITVNPVPSLTSTHVSQLSSTLGTQIWFNATATGGTGPVTFSYTGLPLGCSGNTGSFSCTPTRAGVYTVTVTAVDSYGYTSATVTTNVTVTTPPVKSPGIGTTGWAIVIGIVVIGALATVGLLVQARREERRGAMGMEAESAQEPSEYSGGSPPMGGTPPSGPPS